MDSKVNLENEKSHFDDIWAGEIEYRRIGEPLLVPGIEDLEGKRILVCSCGSGVGPVMAARAGAEVYAVDISEVGVNNAKRMAEYNGVHVKVEVQDLHSLKYPDDFFDVLYGSAVLHHLDLEKACREFRRVLKNGGIAYFQSEPTFINPIIKLLYEVIFGKGRVGRRRKFLFFKRLGTEYEKPFDKEEFAIMEAYFPTFRQYPCRFMFMQKLSHVMGGRMLGITAAIDEMLVKMFPKLGKWSYEWDFMLINTK